MIRRIVFFFSDKHRNNGGVLKQFEDDLRHCLKQDCGHICVKKEHDCDDDNESVAESVASSGLESRAGDSDAEVVHFCPPPGWVGSLGPRGLGGGFIKV